MSCPTNHVCDPPTGTCVAPAPQTTGCKTCLSIIKYIEKKGCADLCKVLGDTIVCELINKLHVCPLISKWIAEGWTPLQACGAIGYCGAGSCPCGYCTPPLYGQFCLAAPNTCPSSVPSLRLFGQWVDDERRSAKGVKGDQFCADGHCTEGNVGCCLTCAP
jgi:hypothetical protein